MLLIVGCFGSRLFSVSQLIAEAVMAVAQPVARLVETEVPQYVWCEIPAQCRGIAAQLTAVAVKRWFLVPVC